MSLQLSVAGRIGALELNVELVANDRPLVLLGPNGAGKTTLLLMVLGLLTPSRGRITLGSSVLFDHDSGTDLPPESRSIGYVPQSYALFPHLSVLDNVAFGAARPWSRRTSAARARAHAILDELHVGALADRAPDTLSGGEQQRVAVARALAAKPRALLLDEPVAALDRAARHRTRDVLVEKLQGLGLPAIVVTHHPDDALALGGDVAVLESGRIVERGPIDALRRAPKTAFLENFFQGAAARAPSPL